MKAKVTWNAEPLFPRVAAAANAAYGLHANPNRRRTLVTPHSIQRQQDELYCARCDRRWGVDEDPPIAHVRPAKRSCD